MQTYAQYLQETYNVTSEGPLTDFITRRDGRLLLGDRIDLNELAERYGAPLEVIYTPQITSQITRMMTYAAEAKEVAGYPAPFLYAYATKANFAAEAVRTALNAGAHYETSAAADVDVAHMLWRDGVLPSNRMIFANGSKEQHYLAAILRLRLAGNANVIPVLDDLDEFQVLQQCPAAFRFGVRERAAGNRDGTHYGGDRFGLTPEEIDFVAEGLVTSRHSLVLYHAMIGSQVEDREHFVATLRQSVENYARLRQKVPTLRYFSFGGGVPTSGYDLGFKFDYVAFLTDLMGVIKETCARFEVPIPQLIGEFGRYTVANHVVQLLEVGQIKSGSAGAPDWYLLNGSMMVSAPDSVLVDQEFAVLPLEGWERPVREVRFGGRRTCDSDDVYPRPHRPALVLPEQGKGLHVAICGVGAYQSMISGRGGAHHCLAPESRRIVIEEINGKLVFTETPQQSLEEIMRLIGYPAPRPATVPTMPLPAHCSSIGYEGNTWRIPAPTGRVAAPRTRYQSNPRSASLPRVAVS
ncbi:MAG: arginine decarboxylase [Chloroflexota bacterium]|nr:arginine decarboxylase [Chloroflexota bacterium]